MERPGGHTWLHDFALFIFPALNPVQSVWHMKACSLFDHPEQFKPASSHCVLLIQVTCTFQQVAVKQVNVARARGTRQTRMCGYTHSTQIISWKEMTSILIISDRKHETFVLIILWTTESPAGHLSYYTNVPGSGNIMNFSTVIKNMCHYIIII